MFGRKDYTPEEFEHGRSAVEKQLVAYKKLLRARAGETTDTQARAALDDFEGLFFNNMTLVLDRYSSTGSEW